MNDKNQGQAAAEMTYVNWTSFLRWSAVLLLAAAPSSFAVFAATQAPAETSPVAVVSVATRTPGKQIPRDFIGFSLEVSTGGQGITAFQGKQGSGSSEQSVYALGHPGSPNQGYFQFMKDLGPGILRLGGNSQDNTCWDRAQAPHPEGCEAELKAGDLKLFNDAVQASGWHLIIGMNLKQNSPSWALREITEGISREIKPQNILALELGNEPDLFFRTPYRAKNYSPVEQAHEFWGYLRAFQANPVAKRYAAVGPATCCDWRNPTDLSLFARTVGPKNLKWLTVHNYSATTCNGKTTSIETLLSPELMGNFNREARPLVKVAEGYHLPIAMAETNSASCGGMPGVSNAFAAALWGLDYSFSIAQDGFVAVDFHTSYRPGGGSSYNPVDTYGTQTASGKWHYRNVAQPLYYGLYLFSKNASGAEFLPASVQSHANIRAYALTHCAGCAVKVVVLNKDLKASGDVHIRLDRKMSKASLLLLEAPSLDARADQVKYGGQQFDSEGKIGVPHTQSVRPNHDGSYSFVLPNAAAAVLTIEPDVRLNQAR